MRGKITYIWFKNQHNYVREKKKKKIATLLDP